MALVQRRGLFYRKIAASQHDLASTLMETRH
jgi:hypothetical protein